MFQPLKIFNRLLNSLILNKKSKGWEKNSYRLWEQNNIRNDLDIKLQIYYFVTDV